jgi:diaminopimelate decarboxylase
MRPIDHHPADLALLQRALPDVGDAAFLIDLDRFDAATAELIAAFPPDTLHTLAIKAGPAGRVLRRAVRNGLGLEAASAGELALALRVAPPDRVVLDSPCKSRADLAAALRSGAQVHLDNLQELERAAQLGPSAGVGLRVNPTVGVGSIVSTSTGMAGSKFGVDLHDHRADVVRAFQRYDWLTGLHVHVGSAGCDLALLASGAAVAAGLAAEIVQVGGAVHQIDIGGGMPVDPEEPSFAAYVAELRRQAPGLLDGPWRVATEMGRRLLGPNGVLVSRVEYTKTSGGRRIALTHAGADLFVRAVLAPDTWELDITVHGPDGAPKSGPLSPWDLGGPLCFSGDVLARGRLLPAIEPGDLLVVHGAGAYTYAHSTRYNSRPMPPIFGVSGACGVEVIHPGQTLDEVVAFWDR